MREADDARLTDLVLSMCNAADNKLAKERVLKGMSGLKARAKTLVELAVQSISTPDHLRWMKKQKI